MSASQIIYVAVVLCSLSCKVAAQKIDREAVVNRHDIILSKADTFSSVTLGNGEFAFTTDITGLQTFYKEYKNGVPLGTESEWGWHSFPNKDNLQRKEAYKYYNLYGRDSVPYCVQPKEPALARAAVEYFRINPHRLQLGNIGFIFLKTNGDTASLKDIKNIHQHLDLYKGILESKFTVDGEPISVTTFANQQADGISFKVESPLIRKKRLFVRIAFPYPTGQFADMGTYFSDTSSHHSSFFKNGINSGCFVHSLDTTRYYVSADWSGRMDIDSAKKNFFILKPDINSDQLECNIIFSPDKKFGKRNFDEVKEASTIAWKNFWQGGGAIDFSGSTDSRADELERRIILSEYLTKVQCAGHYPPQETGLTYNSWYGKPHLEMYWWHAAHFALWGRPELLEKSLDWYITVADKAKEISQRQGFDGIRWQKMTDPSGEESPSSVGAFLIWQQPHFIYLSELLYRTDKNKNELFNKYKDLVYKTADFMASFAIYDSVTHHYNLGKGLIPAQECFNPVETYNPTYELAYWSWALKTAQKWRIRDGLSRNKKWDDVIDHLAPLPEKDGLYLAAQNTPDCYNPNSKYTHDHPAVLAALASIPVSDELDTAVMHRTFDKVNEVWHWNDTWGWDYPLMAMAATRLNLKNETVDMLMRKVQKNTYLPDGNNYQDSRLTIYLPGNGGLLSAIVLMCAGYNDCKIKNPGFDPEKWHVKWEGLNPMP